MLVDGVCHWGGFLAITVCYIADELDDFVERMFVIVPNGVGVWSPQWAEGEGQLHSRAHSVQLESSQGCREENRRQN